MTIDLHRTSGLGRPVDPSFPTNLAVLILIPVIGVGALFGLRVMEPDAGLQFVRAGTIALAAFGAWALMRELDPDRNAAAFVAMAVATLIALRVSDMDLLTLFGALIFSRVVNRTVGPDLYPGDYLALAGLAGWAGWSGDASVLVGGALAFSLDARFGGRTAHWGIGFALLAAAVFVGSTPPSLTEYPAKAAALGLGVLAIGVSLVRRGPLRSRCDDDSRGLEQRRVRGGIAVAGLIGLLAVRGVDADGNSAAALWSVLFVLPFFGGGGSSAFRAPEDAA